MLNEQMRKWKIDTPRRQAAFLAQLAFESGELTIWSGPETGREWEGDEKLGNVLPGDGPKFKTRGLFPIRGRAMYRKCGRAIKAPLEVQPERVATLYTAIESACWYWAKEKKLNQQAEYPSGESFCKITKAISPILKGHRARVMYWNCAKRVLNA